MNGASRISIKRVNKYQTTNYSLSWFTLSCHNCVCNGDNSSSCIERYLHEWRSFFPC